MNIFDKNPEKCHKVSDKDITVYKYGNVSKDDNSFHPNFQENFSYKANVLTEEIKLNLEKYENALFGMLVCYIIKEGYHSYSYSYSKSIFNFLDKHIGKFIIPKGSEYYENDLGEIVSSQIMWSGESYSLNDIEYADINYENKANLKDIDYVLENRKA